MNMATELDIGPLTWVKSEIDLALERAGEALGQFAASREAAQIAQARNHLRQARGALTIVGLEGVTQFAETIEALLAGFEDGSLEPTPQATELGCTGFAAIRHYLDDLIDGRPDQALRLFPAYRDSAVARGQPVPEPTELFFPDLTLRPPRRERAPAPLAPEAFQARIRAARLGFQRGLLKWLRQDPKGAADMRMAVAMVEMTQAQPASRAFWWASMAFFDALAGGSNEADAATKKLCVRIEAQLRKLIEGSATVADRLMRDVLYQVARAPRGSDHLECVRAAYRLDSLIPQIGETRDITPLKPILRAGRDLLASTKEHWNRYCAGTSSALAQFRDSATQLTTRVADLGQPEIARLAEAIRATADAIAAKPAQHGDAAALEMATALLLLESALEHFPEVGLQFAHQVDTVTGRLSALLRGEALGTLEIPQLGEISRRAQERLLMHQVAKEILVNLAVVEQVLDGFFRNPVQRSELGQLNKPLIQITGALTVLGQERAVEVLRECEARIASFRDDLYMPQQADFEEVAVKLSGLGFFVEKLQFGPADLDAILNPAPVVVEAAPLTVEQAINKALTQSQILTAQFKAAASAAAQGELRDEIKHNLKALQADAALVADQGLAEQAGAALKAIETEQAPTVIEAALDAVVENASASAAALAPSAETARLAKASRAEVDAELLAIFLEEAHEVLATIAANVPQLAAQPHDRETLTTIRRSFHTLKGSGRMVGLAELGEAAWAVEQTLNKWLQQERLVSPPLLAMLGESHTLFQDWVAQIEGNWRDAAALVAQCEDLRSEEEAAAAPMPAASLPEPVAAAAPEAAVPGKLPSLAVVPEATAIVASAALQPPEAFPAPAAAFAPAASNALSFERVPELPAAAVELPGTEAPSGNVRVGDQEISRTLYEIYLAEARSYVSALRAGLASEGHIDRDLLRVAHTLAGISATTGLPAVYGVAHALELAFGRLLDTGVLPNEPQRMLLARAVGALDGMVGAIAERRLPQPEAGLAAELDSLKPHLPEAPPAAEEIPVFELPALEMPAAPVMPAITAAPELTAAQALSEEEALERRQSRLRDDLDPQLLPFFLEEAQDLMRDIGTELRHWRERPDDVGIANQLRRLLHTLKGSARMAGAMSIGEIVHGLEARIEVSTDITPIFLDDIEATCDRTTMLVDKLRRLGDVDAREPGGAAAEPVPVTAAAVPGAPVVAEHHEIVAPVEEAAGKRSLRVRADLVDKLVNEAGEMAIARARIEGEMRTVKAALIDLTENVIRLRTQLREIEIQAESQMQSQLAGAQAYDVNFDPLEFDRFTRFQELTRMMAESVNDVSTVQHNLLRNLDHANAALIAQSRLNRELSQALMSVRMVPFSSVAERLYRVVRQTAKELDKRANLDIRGGQTELDRSVLEAMIGPIEHLLRNAVAHGLEQRDQRAAAGKPEIGEIQLSLSQAGNEVLIEMSDDGAGLDLARIRARAIERGLLGADAASDDIRIMAMIFQPGFSTAAAVTAVAGRGVGMDVVKNETANLGGRVEVASEHGHGARFRIYLPLTLAVTQAVLVRAGSRLYAIPSAMVEQVGELKPEPLAAIRQQGGTDWLGNHYPWHYLTRLLGNPGAQPLPSRRHWLMLLKGGSQRIALEVDGLLGNEEVVIKNIGPQLARVVGIAGATVLADGEVALIINPIALAGREVAALEALTQTTVQRISEEVPVAATPTVMVVDDSLTVRKITGRLLAREGYHVITAKDGVDALEQLGEVIPDVMLVDIEMPRMDGFDLTRNVRADARTRGIPIIMITSRIADKHRNYAMEIGVNHYFGKPYDEDELIKLIGGYVKKP